MWAPLREPDQLFSNTLACVISFSTLVPLIFPCIHSDQNGFNALGFGIRLVHQGTDLLCIPFATSFIVIIGNPLEKAFRTLAQPLVRRKGTGYSVTTGESAAGMLNHVVKRIGTGLCGFPRLLNLCYRVHERLVIIIKAFG